MLSVLQVKNTNSQKNKREKLEALHERKSNIYKSIIMSRPESEREYMDMVYGYNTSLNPTNSDIEYLVNSESIYINGVPDFYPETITVRLKGELKDGDFWIPWTSLRRKGIPILSENADELTTRSYESLPTIPSDLL